MTPKLIGYRLKKDLPGLKAGEVISAPVYDNITTWFQRLCVDKEKVFDFFEPIYEEEKSDEELLKTQIEKWVEETCGLLTLKEFEPLEYVAKKLLSTFNLDLRKLKEE